VGERNVVSLVRASRVTSRSFQVSPVRLFLIIVPILLVLGFRTNAQAPDDSNLNDLAAHAAAAIRTESKRSLGPTRVLVVDFTEMHDKPTELGRQLAEGFSAFLRKQSHLVVDRGESLRAVAADRLLSGSLEGPDVTRCYDNEVGGAVVVEGMIDSLAGQFSVGIRVWHLLSRRPVFQGCLEGENPRSRASLSGDCCRWVSNENIDNPRSSVWLK
jgi:hypothetical protein